MIHEGLMPQSWPSVFTVENRMLFVLGKAMTTLLLLPLAEQSLSACSEMHETTHSYTIMLELTKRGGAVIFGVCTSLRQPPLAPATFVFGARSF